MGVLLQDHDVRQSEFQQLPYHRIFIMLLLELNAPEHVLETINFQTLTAFWWVIVENNIVKDCCFSVIKFEKNSGLEACWFTMQVACCLLVSFFFFFFLNFNLDCSSDQGFLLSATHSTSWGLPKLLALCMLGLNWSPIGYLLQECWHTRHSRRCGCSLSPTDEDCNYLGLSSTCSHSVITVLLSGLVGSPYI